MKKALPLVALLLSVLFAAAQSITLSFTAADQNGSYHSFTSVKIENLTHAWQHTLNYPDTVLVIQVTDGVGELEGQSCALRLAGSNPFNGTTYAELSLAEAGQVEIDAIQLDGKMVAHTEGYLPSGIHRIKFDAADPQLYLLVAKTAQGSHAVKLMNMGNGCGNAISLERAEKPAENSGAKSREVGTFMLGDEMRFTAYNGTESSEVLTQNLLEGGTITLTFNVDAPVPTAWFSVSDDTQVRFSHGNLQYQPSTGTWRFADRQYDLIGANNDQISSTSYTGWIDLFGWGTGNNPTCASEENNAYGDFTDWGTNPISNGGNAANQWRTLTNDEWEYLMLTRNTTSGIRFVKANVSLTNGLVILPDDWDASYYTLSNINNTSAYWTTNSISHDDWMSIFEAHGAIFLPAAGKRTGTSIYDTRGGGYYWSSSPHGNDYADYLFFSGSNLSMKYQSRYSGYSVRLVADE